ERPVSRRREVHILQGNATMFVCRLAVLFAILCLGGCSDNATLARVTGKVTLDGKPLAKGTIIFESKGQRPATGSIVNGEIVDVTTYKSSDGVPLGQHQVAISATEDTASAVVPNPGEDKVGANYMSGKSLI